MGQELTGGCFCGAVRFVAAGPPLVRRMCWCRDCQYLSCGNASVNVVVTSAGLAVTGATAAYASVADSGAAMLRRFCPACGTPLFSEAVAQPDYVVIRVGALDDPGLGGPESVIWAGSAPGWACFDPGLPRSARHVEAVPPG